MKRSIALLAIMGSSLCLPTLFAQNSTTPPLHYQPLTTPIAYTQPAKPNIFFMLDSSWSMAENRDIRDYQNRLISRSEASTIAMQTILKNYRNHAYFGVGSWPYVYPGEPGTWTFRRYYDFPYAPEKSESETRNNASMRSIVHVPLIETSIASNYHRVSRFIDRYANDFSEPYFLGNNTLLSAYFEASKYMRGEKTFRSIRSPYFGEMISKYGLFDFSLLNLANRRGVPTFERHELPIKYRCQHQHILVLTDASEIDGDGIYGIPTIDTPLLSNTNYDHKLVYDGYAVGSSHFDIRNNTINPQTMNPSTVRSRGNNFKLIGNFLGSLDLTRGRYLGQYDSTGQKWHSEGSIDMKLNIHTIAFADKSSPVYNQGTSDIIEDFTNRTHGIYRQVNSLRELDNAFNHIFATVIPPVQHSNYLYDQVNIGRDTHFYSVQHDSSTWSSEIIAYRLALPSNRAVTPGDRIQLVRHWSTSDRLKPVDLTNTKAYNPLVVTHTKSAYASIDHRSTYPIYQITTSRNYRKALGSLDLAKWYVAGKNDLYTRERPGLLGDIINTPLIYFAPDILYAPYQEFNAEQKKQLEQHHFPMRMRKMPYATLNAASNDGMISVIRAERDISTDDAPLYRPQVEKGDRIRAILHDRVVENLDNIGDPAYLHQFAFDGEVSLVDRPSTSGDLLPTYLLIANGSKAKGITVLGYGTQNVAQSSQLDHSYLPERITIGEYLDNQRAGWEDLGYLYNKIEVLIHPFTLTLTGNGYGSAQGKSILYYAHLDEGNPLLNQTQYQFGNPHAILLNPQGGGANSPATYTDSNGIPKATYIGDLTGGLYRVDWIDLNRSNPNYRVTKIFQDPDHHPIHAQPVIVKDENGDRWVFFGTGLNKREVDRQSKAIYHFYGIRDREINFTLNPDRDPFLEQNLLSMREIPKNEGTSTAHEYREYEVDMTHHARDEGLPAQYYGWKIPLVLYKKGNDQQVDLNRPILTGERVVSPAIYFAGGKRILGIRTWGIHTHSSQSDPCLPDQLFSKLLYVDLWTGGKGTNKYGEDVLGRGTEGVVIGAPIGKNVYEGNPSTSYGLHAPQPPFTLSAKGSNNPKDPNIHCDSWITIGEELICDESVNSELSNHRSPQRAYLKLKI